MAAVTADLVIPYGRLRVNHTGARIDSGSVVEPKGPAAHVYRMALDLLAHELGHIRCGKPERLDDCHTGHAGHRRAMEVEAESFSCVLSRMNGMTPTSSRHPSMSQGGRLGSRGAARVRRDAAEGD